MQPAACYAVAGTIDTCKEVQVDGERYLRLGFDAPVASRVDCGRVGPSPAAGEIAVALERLQRQRRFYLEPMNADRCDTVRGSRFTGGVIELCCDTYPPTGACRLDAPLLAPRRFPTGPAGDGGSN